jgi:hypothetical protein
VCGFAPSPLPPPMSTRSASIRNATLSGGRTTHDFSGPCLGPETPPDASGSLCSSFCGGLHVLSSIPDPFCDQVITKRFHTKRSRMINLRPSPQSSQTKHVLLRKEGVSIYRLRLVLGCVAPEAVANRSTIGVWGQYDTPQDGRKHTHTPQTVCTSRGAVRHWYFRTWP